MIPNAPTTSQSVERRDSPMCVVVTLMLTALMVTTTPVTQVAMSVCSNAKVTLIVVTQLYVIWKTILTTHNVTTVRKACVKLDVRIALTARLIMTVSTTFV